MCSSKNKSKEMSWEALLKWLNLNIRIIITEIGCRYVFYLVLSPCFVAACKQLFPVADWGSWGGGRGGIGNNPLG